jgi:hypothetical protein
MSNTRIVEFNPLNHAAKLMEQVTEEIAAGKSKALGQYEINELYEYKLLNKATYIQLAIAHDFGILVDPRLDSDECQRFAEKWSREAEEITASDMRKAIDKILCATYKNEPKRDKYPQLNLFE